MQSFWKTHSNFIFPIPVIRRIWTSVKRSNAQGKPARWNYNKYVQDFKIGISFQVEKIDKGGSKGRIGHMGHMEHKQQTQTPIGH